MPRILRRYILPILVFCLAGYVSNAQKPPQIDFSGIVLGADSIPVPDVAIINPRTGKTVRTNEEGFFHTQMDEGDSLLVYHIAYRRVFLHFRDNLKKFVLIPEIQELQTVIVTENEASARDKAEKLSSDIVNVALSKKLEGFDKKSRQDYFYETNAIHNRAFSEHFGPTFHLSFGQIAHFLSKIGGKKRNKKK